MSIKILNNEWSTLSGKIVAETNKAILFKFKDDADEEQSLWFPISQVKRIKNTQGKVEHGEDEIDVKNWLLRKADIAFESDEND